MKNRKISIITIHDNHNFGSMLQCYALSKALEELSCDAEFIDYVRDGQSLRRAFSRMFLSCSFKNFILGFARIPNMVVNTKIYRGFLRNYITLTKLQYSSFDQLQKNPPEADVYMTGSDQVWNSLYNEGIDETYFFTYLPKNKIRVAYSASFGREQIDEKEAQIIKEHLNNYKAISVREKSAVFILSQLGIKDVKHTLDPIFLLDRFQWQKIMPKKLVQNPYLLMFIPYGAKNMNKIVGIARRIASEKKLKVVAFSWSFLSIKGIDKTIKYANPNDFLSIFHYADYVVTNSFHGTAFSINLNKQFISLYPDKFQTRLVSILEMFELDNRIFSEEAKWNDKLPTDIDYEKVNTLLDTERKRSFDYLKTVINL